MSNTFDWAKATASDFRFSITVVSALVLGILMLFFKDLTLFMRETLVPSLAIYSIGTGVIAGAQTIVATWFTGRFNLEINAVGGDLQKTNARPALPPKGLVMVIIAQCLWFVLWCVYNLMKI